MKPLPFNPDNWYELKSWAYRFGGVPSHLLASHDRSESYQMDRAHAFKIRPGRYALVTESGCSCYTEEDARIFIYGDERSLMADYSKWFDGKSWEFQATGTEAKP